MYFKIITMPCLFFNISFAHILPGTLKYYLKMSVIGFEMNNFSTQDQKCIIYSFLMSQVTNINLICRTIVFRNAKLEKI